MKPYRGGVSAIAAAAAAAGVAGVAGVGAGALAPLALEGRVPGRLYPDRCPETLNPPWSVVSGVAHVCDRGALPRTILHPAADKIMKMSATSHNFRPRGKQNRENECDLAQY